VVWPPLKGPKKKKKKKKKNEKWVLDFCGWPDHPQGLGGGFGHPLRPVWGGRSHPRPLGVVGHPKKSKTHFSFFFFFFFFGLAFWVSRTTPLGLGVVRPPQIGCGGSSSHPAPILANGMAPDFHLSFFFFFFFFFFFDSHLFNFFFKKNFNAQNNVVLGWVGVAILESVRGSFGARGKIDIFVKIFCTKWAK
jgi:hypothetical protein